MVGIWLNGTCTNVMSDSILMKKYCDVDFKTFPLEAGSVLCNKATEIKYLEGTTLSITAEAEEGYYFKTWSDGDTTLNRTLTLSQDTSLYAIFHKKEGYPFAVSDSTQVIFSPGDLQYNAALNKWRFFTPQYQRMIKVDDDKLGSNVNKWFGDFCWATSGYHDEEDTNNKYYHPYDCSTYGGNNTELNSTGYGPSIGMPDTSLIGASANYDWGVFNKIEGFEEANWRCLTYVEVEYIKKHTTWAFANVNGVLGLILTPTNWDSLPEGITVVPGTRGSNANKYTQTQWHFFEAIGCVFLTGYRYWTSTYLDNRNAGILNNSIGSYISASNAFKHDRCRVRLVSDYKTE